jgi:hypothetical protein
VELRRRLPAGIRLYTGDDFNYAELIRGDATGYSDALHSDAMLGAFAAITAPAAAALAALDRGDVAGYHAAMGPTVPLSRLIFEPPTITSGGTPGCRTRSPGRARGSSATSWRTGCSRCRRTRCSAAATPVTG